MKFTNECHQFIFIMLYSVQHYIDISCRGRVRGVGGVGVIIIKTWHITTFIFPLMLKLWDDMIVFFKFIPELAPRVFWSYFVKCIEIFSGTVLSNNHWCPPQFLKQLWSFKLLSQPKLLQLLTLLVMQDPLTWNIQKLLAKGIFLCLKI